MIGKLILVFIFIVQLSYHLIGQEKPRLTIEGIVLDSASNQPIIGSSIFLKEIHLGSITNEKGEFKFDAPEGNYMIIVSMMGYAEYNQTIHLNHSYKFKFIIAENTRQKEEITIQSNSSKENISNTQMGIVDLSIKDIKKIPAFMGEVDPLKAFQLTPGVQRGSDNSNGIYVRGGNLDQSLILFENAVVYNPTHLYGFFSVFNSSIIDNVKFLKSSLPANYGGRLSSVIAITSREGNLKEYKGNGNLGLISSDLCFEGPIKRDTASFLIAYRRTYMDALAKPFASTFQLLDKLSGYHFYDLNVKLIYKPTKNNKLILSSYYGKDSYRYVYKTVGSGNNINWGNFVTTLSWNHYFNDHFLTTTSISLSTYNFNFNYFEPIYNFNFNSDINHLNLKNENSYTPNNRNLLKFGVLYNQENYTPLTVEIRSKETALDLPSNFKFHARDFGSYIDETYDFNEKIKIEAGLRFSIFQQLGMYTHYNINTDGTIHDSTIYSDNQIVKTYYGLEPRISARYLLNNTSSLKTSFTRTNQYVNMASVASITIPSDIWFPSTNEIKPQQAYQYVAGYYRSIFKNIFDLSAEAYYKYMTNQVEFKDGAMPGTIKNSNFEDQLAFGTGKSYGLELLISKKVGKLTGWIAYTLSKSTRLFPDLNNGKEFPATYDRRNNLSLLLSYDYNKKWNFSAVFVYTTGSAMTIPVSRYIISQNIVNEYSDRNAYRLPDYHRLDISATYITKKTEKIETSWNFSIYNVYNRANPYYIYYDITGDLNNFKLQIQAKQFSLFPILPSVKWSFKF